MFLEPKYLICYIMKSNYAHLIVMLVIVIYPVIVRCTMCYTCRSDKHEKCNDQVVDESYLEQCPEVSKLRAYTDADLPEGVIGNVVFCRKVLQYLKFINDTKTTIVARECTVFHKEKDDCYFEMTQAFQLTVCECRTDGCNVAPILKCTEVPWLLLFLLVFRHLAVLFPT